MLAPLVQFYRLIEQARLPQRADRSGDGTLPTRAYRYCEAVTSATGFGWWIFPPMDLQLIWDGQDIYWHFAGADDWMPLTSSVQFPDFSQAFNAAAPAALQDCAPPFLTPLPEPGCVQLWTGIMVQTAPDWSLLSRAPVNVNVGGGYAVYEGIVESDLWFGPVFTNLRLTRTHKPVQLHSDRPLLQVQPLPRLTYSDATLGAMSVVPSMASMDSAAWDAYHDSIVAPSDDPERGSGRYAVAVRKRRRGTCPYSGAQGQQQAQPA